MNDIQSDSLPDGGRKTLETEFDGQLPSIAILHAIAAMEGVRPAEIGFLLYHSVDPGALDELVESSPGTVTVELSIEDYVVTITESRRLTLELAADTRE